MSEKPVVPRAVARRDVEAIVDGYMVDGSEQAALGFISALEDAYQHIGHFPETGSQRYAHELDLPELRVWKLKRYPHLIFYINQPEHIDVWRVLHSSRDIAVWLNKSGND